MSGGPIGEPPKPILFFVRCNMSLDTAASTARLRGLTTKFDNAVMGVKPFYPRICNVVESKRASEEHGILGRVPGVREWLGDRDWHQLRAARWVIENRKWESSLLIARDDIADDTLGMYVSSLQQLGVQAARHPDELVVGLLEENGECWDGQEFFDVDHSWGDSGEQSNALTFDASDHTSVTAAEFKLAYNAAVASLAGYRDDRGKLLNAEVIDESRGYIVIVPITLMQVAHDALSVKLTSTGGENVVIGRPEVVGLASLTATTKFIVAKTDEPLKPLIFQARKPLQREIEGLDSIEKKDAKFMTEARYNVGYGAWWTAVQTTFN